MSTIEIFFPTVWPLGMCMLIISDWDVKTNVFSWLQPLGAGWICVALLP